ncbi:putative glycolipid-binding domain-containing protein [uncultured Microbacterium sp.]|uniref:putative glycolipid-binding domain-containing protein n=1 Tax=uncultured Microbacterium sp. TaxID=191216 RepID=UPI0025D3C8BD|nr:putative glycolipid-binding domain-containing protein [uncultured Microbacterium sp.]
MTLCRQKWTSLPDGDRTDEAHLQLTSEGMYAFGTAIAPDYALSWRLDAGEGWVTRELRVTAEAFEWSRSLVLRRSPDGVWSSQTNSMGSVGLPDPGLADPESLSTALDCDLGLCPVTNTMPIRRLGLLEREVPPTPLIMAWVEVPSLRVLRSDQLYASSPRPGRVRYRSLHRDFEAELLVDQDGVVIEYPTLARRVDH